MRSPNPGRALSKMQLVGLAWRQGQLANVGFGESHAAIQNHFGQHLGNKIHIPYCVSLLIAVTQCLVVFQKKAPKIKE